MTRRPSSYEIKRGPDLVIYARPRGFRVAGPEATAVVHVLGLPRTITAGQLDDVLAYAQAHHLLLVVSTREKRNT